MSTERDQTQQRGNESTLSTRAPHDHRRPDVEDWQRGDPAEIATADADASMQFLQRIAASQPAWKIDAACVGTDLELWFPITGQRAQPALDICGRCAVRADCLTEALADPALDYGIRGGMTATARKQRRKTSEAQGPGGTQPT